MVRPEEPLALPTNALQRLGSEVRHLRHLRGLTLTQLADACGRSPSSLASLEHGRRNVGEQFIRSLDELLGANGNIVGHFEDVLQEQRDKKLSRHPERRSDRRDVAVAGDASTFIADVSIPSGTLMSPGEHFEKTWRIKNSGTVTWSRRYLSRRGSAGGASVIASPPLTPIPDAMPGDVIDVSVPCRAHMVEGTSRAYFKMSDENGNLFFPLTYSVGLDVQITVIDQGA